MTAGSLYRFIEASVPDCVQYHAQITYAHTMVFSIAVSGELRMDSSRGIIHADLLLSCFQGFGRGFPPILIG
jgi:hypothetical protein